VPVAVPPPPVLAVLFRRQPVVVLDDLRRALQTPSRTTVFRALHPLGYVTSFSHRGRYYTLRRIPRFDVHGLWWYQDIGFSAHGTLLRTLTHLVDIAPAGHSHDELRETVRLRVHNTLRQLVRADKLLRRPWENAFLYLSTNPVVAEAQWHRRQALAAPVPVVLDSAGVIDVLVHVIHHPHEDAAALAHRLRGAGRTVHAEQVEAVLARYGVKKTPRRPSRRSPR